MTEPANWARVQALFEAALDWPVAEQEQRLIARAGDDAALLARVRELLAAHASTNPLDAPVQVRESEVEVAPLPPGTRLGVWSLGERLGRGGMGEVYAAERVDGVVAQQAAVKVLKRGLDTEAVLARFLRERSILARLSHPHIARLLDAGATDDGRPWLVMERIQGRPIDLWLREHGATLEQCLLLMRMVCEAVHEAHRNLIVHRDLKPANVLVTADGQVKLLDFGIAKILDEETPDATRLSGTALPMTPAYAAPEQWRGDNVTTATDIYALGVMLYALLTGRLPREPTTVAGLAQAVTRPSEALRGKPDGSASSLRRTGWRRDLDLIVLKALHDEPDRRYASAQALANDLARYLAHEPVSAAPDAWSYRARMFVRRNRALSAGIAATTLSLLLGLAGVLWQAHQARLAATRADRLVEYLAETLSAANPQRHAGQWPTVLDLLAEASRKVGERFADDTLAQARLYATFNGIYNRLNQPERVAELAPRALKANIAAYGAGSRPVAVARQELSETLFGLGDYHGCIEQSREAARLFRQLDGPASSDAVSTLTLLQSSYARLGMLRESEETSRELIEIARNNPKEDAWGIAQLEHNLASAHVQGWRLREALALLEQAQAHAGRLPDSERAGELVLKSNLMRQRIRLWLAPDDAAEQIARWIHEADQLLGPNNHISRAIQANQVLLDAEQGRYDKAATQQAALAAAWAQASGAEHPQTLRARIEALRLAILGGVAPGTWPGELAELERASNPLFKDATLDNARAALSLLRIRAAIDPQAAPAAYQALTTLLSVLPAGEPVVQAMAAEGQAVLAQTRQQPTTAAASLETVLHFLDGTAEGATRLHAGLGLYRAYLLRLAGDPTAEAQFQAARQWLPTTLPADHPLRRRFARFEPPAPAGASADIPSLAFY